MSSTATSNRPKSLPQSQYGRTWLYWEDFPHGYFFFKAIERREKYLAEKQKQETEYLEMFETMFGAI